jgi:RNA polymerase sigma-70 factor (ECF subfamily)
MASPGVLPPFAFNATYIQSLRQGDPSTEEHFVSHFSPILLRKLQGKLRSTDRARDLRQETFLRVLTVLRSDHGVRQPERFEIFVLGVCKNVLREACRQEKPLMQMPAEFDLASHAPGPYACALAAETGHYVRKALSRLAPYGREILRAALLEEQSRDEICLRFGITRNRLRLLIHRAKKELRACAQGKQGNTGRRRGPRKRGRRVFTAFKPELVRRTSEACPAPVFLPPLHATDAPASQSWL